MPRELRSADAADAFAICTLLRRSITECCVADHANDAERLAAWLRNKTPENVSRWLLSAGNASFVTVQDAAITGFALLNNAGEVALCYVLPEARFTGTGKVLLTAMEDCARQRGLTALRLHSTRSALDFYLRNGFQVTDEAVVVFGITATPLRKTLT
ncbi:GNAT family N-acetyltransferase [Viridibacterium curvum]|uniref:N-acetyltransferase domain-containing protein n=1 Tax=Viridibacterium curvum TaxID=1101404 RepID=A0ABP9QSC1_9RHOO